MTHMETYKDGIRCHAALAKVTAELAQAKSEFAGTQRDTLTSFIETSGKLVAMKAERNAARATIARVEALATRWELAAGYHNSPPAAVELRAAIAEPTE